MNLNAGQYNIIKGSFKLPFMIKQTLCRLKYMDLFRV